MENKNNETKDKKGLNLINKNENENNYKSILLKIKNKTIILEFIYFFAKQRPYILLDLISNDKILKSSLKNTFNNTKKENYLSSKLNTNIYNYISYRELRESINCKINILENIFINNDKLNNIIRNPLINNKFFEIKEIKEFIKNPPIKNINDEFIEKFIDKNVKKNKKNNT